MNKTQKIHFQKLWAEYPDLTQEEAEKKYFEIYKEFSGELKIVSEKFREMAKNESDSNKTKQN